MKIISECSVNLHENNSAKSLTISGPTLFDSTPPISNWNLLLLVIGSRFFMNWLTLASSMFMCLFKTCFILAFRIVYITNTFKWYMRSNIGCTSNMATYINDSTTSLNILISGYILNIYTNSTRVSMMALNTSLVFILILFNNNIKRALKLDCNAQTLELFKLFVNWVLNEITGTLKIIILYLYLNTLNNNYIFL